MPRGENDIVGCIKAIRKYSGLGLKESKDIVDRLRNGSKWNGTPKPEYIKVSHEDYSKAFTTLRDAGLTV